MTRRMIGPVLLLAAMVSPEIRPAPPAPQPMTAFQPAGGAAARATATVRILSGARFGREKSGNAAGATRRTMQLADQDGRVYPVEILEFQ